MDILQSLGGFTEGQAKVDVISQTQGHDIGVVFAEFQRGSVLGKSREIHLEKIDGELAIDVVKLVFIFSVGFLKICFVYFLQVAEVIWTLRIDTLVDDEEPAVFLRVRVCEQ